MQISERKVGDVMIVDVSGKITLGDGGDVVLKDKMASLIQQGHKKVLLNLGDVSYVDSAGLGEIVQSYATVTKNGGSLKLLNVTKRIKDLLSITKLLTVFECHDSESRRGEELQRQAYRGLPTATVRRRLPATGRPARRPAPSAASRRRIGRMNEKR